MAFLLLNDFVTISHFICFATYKRYNYTLDLNEGSSTLYLDGATMGTAFHLDTSTLDGTHLLL